MLAASHACSPLARLQKVFRVLRLWCSLAIMTDAAHLLSDVSGFGVAVFAGFYAAKKSQSTHTFGYVWPIPCVSVG